MTNRYSGVGKSVVSKTGNYMKPGKYKVQIEAVKEVRGQMGKDYFVVEMLVLESSHPDIPVQSHRSWLVDLSESNVMRWPNIKAFVCAASGVDGALDNATAQMEQVWQKMHPEGKLLAFDDIVATLVVGANALKGLQMNLECVEITKRDGDPFTKHNWQPAD